jgi:hypothetical protein
LKLPRRGGNKSWIEERFSKRLGKKRGKLLIRNTYQEF